MNNHKQNWLPSFYPIFDHSDWISRALAEGVKLAQLRIKDKPLTEIRAEIIKVNELGKKHHAMVFINDYWQLAIECDCPYLHLGQEDMQSADVDAIRRAGIKLGISSHSEQELDNALSFSPDYIALGPVYPTTSKDMPWKPQGLENVRRWKNALGNIPLVAIGGITLERAPAIYAAGADCLSVISDVTLNENPELRMRQWLKAKDQ